MTLWPSDHSRSQLSSGNGQGQAKLAPGSNPIVVIFMGGIMPHSTCSACKILPDSPNCLLNSSSRSQVAFKLPSKPSIALNLHLGSPEACKSRFHASNRTFIGLKCFISLSIDHPSVLSRSTNAHAPTTHRLIQLPQSFLGPSTQALLVKGSETVWERFENAQKRSGRLETARTNLDFEIQRSFFGQVD